MKILITEINNEIARFYILRFCWWKIQFKEIWSLDFRFCFWQFPFNIFLPFFCRSLKSSQTSINHEAFGFAFMQKPTGSNVKPQESQTKANFVFPFDIKFLT